ncbi:hypothetical protein C1646_753026 [Rhizophagus diaphanus]|nr:hypothetical protein C1646_753026 [Rhizophagus diaphanus] [Rhizophagus sp. MUCL 43196]
MPVRHKKPILTPIHLTLQLPPTSVAGNETVSLADDVKKYDTAKLIEFLREQDLDLDEDDEIIIRNEKIAGRDFLKMTKQDFKDINMKAEPALRLVDFAKDCKDKKLKAFLSYRSLNKSPLNIRFTESALEEGSEEEKELCKNVKQVMEVIVELLKDRVDVEKEPAMKKQRVKGGASASEEIERNEKGNVIEQSHKE